MPLERKQSTTQWNGKPLCKAIFMGFHPIRSRQDRNDKTDFIDIIRLLLEEKPRKVFNRLSTFCFAIHATSVYDGKQL